MTLIISGTVLEGSLQKKSAMLWAAQFYSLSFDVCYFDGSLLGEIQLSWIVYRLIYGSHTDKFKFMRVNSDSTLVYNDKIDEKLVYLRLVL